MAKWEESIEDFLLTISFCNAINKRCMEILREGGAPVDNNKEKEYERAMKTFRLLKTQNDVADFNNKILGTAKASYLAGDSPEVFYQKVGTIIDELGDYIKENVH